MSDSKLRIAIIGGGINGFACGLKILETLSIPIDVTIISELFTPKTTSDVAAGLWGPSKLGSTPPTKVIEWSQSMHNFLHDIWLSEDAAEAGVCLLPVLSVTTDVEELNDYWRDVVYGYTKFNQCQLEKLNKARGEGDAFLHASQFVTFTSEPMKLLPYLMKKFKLAGGHIVEQKISNFDDFANNSDYNVFINCTGLGSRKLFNDKDAYSVRGQISRVKADWMYYVLLHKNGNYIIPNFNSVVLGGTAQKDDYNLMVSQADKNSIITGCQKLVPALKTAPLLKDLVGLRPGRVAVRIETETMNNGKLLIHNYGHGGSGVTTSWGCATEVTNIVQNIFKSKL